MEPQQYRPFCFILFHSMLFWYSIPYLTHFFLLCKLSQSIFILRDKETKEKEPERKTIYKIYHQLYIILVFKATVNAKIDRFPLFLIKLTFSKKLQKTAKKKIIILLARQYSKEFYFFLAYLCSISNSKIVQGIGVTFCLEYRMCIVQVSKSRHFSAPM